MKTITATILLLAAVSYAMGQDIRPYGVKINVLDMEKARDFYCTKLGFVADAENNGHLFLKSGNATKLVLRKVSALPPESQTEACAGLCLQVNDLTATMNRLRAQGIDFGDESIRKEGVGNAIHVADPFGKRISLMHQTVRQVEPFPEPRIYNYGFLIPDMNRAMEFYGGLGFVPLSQKYLPLDMPLANADRSFGFMLHYREGIEAIRHNTPDTQHIVILFQTSDLDKTISSMKEKGVSFLQKKPVDTQLGRAICYYDPFGYLSEIVEVK
jgi:lactoylglutathione lyase